MVTLEPEVWARQWDEIWDEIFAAALSLPDEDEEPTES